MRSLLIIALLGLVAGQLQKPLIPSKTHERKPNILFILTDDQDYHLDSLSYTPLTKKHLIDEGTLFQRHFCTIALCCPSRVSLWTGKAAHNTNVTDVNPPYGGYPKFIAQGLNENWLPLWLGEAGYNTYYTGKLFNQHTVWNYDNPYPSGFTGSDFLLDPYTYEYLNSSYQRNQDTPVSHEGEYSTDVLASKAYGFLDDAAESDKPFFLVVAPNAPHSNVALKTVLPGDPPLSPEFEFGAPVSADRHRHLFKDVKIPRTPHFNPEHPSGANWVRKLPRQNQTNIDYNDHFYRQRLRALQAVDELVDGLFGRLEKYDLLDNTYIFYSADNGYSIGQHRRQPGKECGYEEDINIPLIVRGPGVAKNHTTELVTTHTDLAPTFLSLIGAKLRPDFDGTPIPIHTEELAAASEQRKWHEHVNVEYWGMAVGEGKFGGNDPVYNNTYKALRVIGNDYNLYYSVWCNDEHELYNLDTDPYQLDNLLLTKDREETVLNLPLTKVVPRLDSLLFVLKSCKGDVCRKPWEALHPNGRVENLQDALDTEFDHFYVEEQIRIKYNRCEQGYIVDAEGPQFDVDGLVFRGGVHWSEWV